MNPGRYADDNGLYLVVRPTGKKAWVYRYQLHGKRRDVGLGAYPLVSLKMARDKHLDFRRQVQAGEHPAKKPEPEAKPVVTTLPTFKAIAAKHIEMKSPDWSNPKHITQWTNTLTEYAYPVIGDKPFDEVNTEDVLAILEPIWNEKRETATRVRARIERVLASGYARHGLSSGNNPARWPDHLKELLPSNKVEVKNFKAMDYKLLPRFMADLRKRDALSARALEFIILTGARTREVRFMTWDEVDGAVWTIPAHKYKTRKEHRAPLSPAAVKILDALPRIDEFVFSNGSGKELSENAMLMLLKRMHAEITVHGFRSSFRDWISEETHTANHVAEMALGHSIGTGVEAAYRRGDLFDHRQTLMNAWSDYLK